MPITLLDGILLAITLFSGVLAMVRGFSREVLSVASWLVAAATAFYFYKQAVPFVQPYVDNQLLAQAAAAGAIFLVTLVIATVITMKIADFIIDSSVGALDRTLGFVFGAARGVLLVVVAMLFFNWLAQNNQPTWITNAKSKPLLDSLGQQLVSLLPEDPEAMIEKVKTGAGGALDQTDNEGAVEPEQPKPAADPAKPAAGTNG
ncbi:MAG: CvpA family protein [Rhizobiaceae bacterium]